MNATRLALAGLALGLLSVSIPLADDAASPRSPAAAAQAPLPAPPGDLGLVEDPATLCVHPAPTDALRQPESEMAEFAGAANPAAATQAPASGLAQKAGAATRSAVHAVVRADAIDQPPSDGQDLQQAQLRLVQMLTAEADRPHGRPASAPRLRQPASVRQAGFQSEDDYLDPAPGTAPRSPALRPIPDPVSTSSEAGLGACSAGSDACGNSAECDSLLFPCSPCRAADPWKLPQPSLMQQWRLELGGWIDQGISAVANNPADGYNGVVTFNDRDAEYQMNQLYAYLERKIDNDGGGWDVGGRVDFLYGTDARFTECIDGLEANWHQTERFYQAALPQFYFDVAFNEWKLRAGHFYSIVGYETVMATGNFFYSHSYVHQYGEPFTHTGMWLMRDLGEHWSFTAGLQRGDDQFDDTDGLDAAGFLGGVTWRGFDDRLSLAFAISADEFGPHTNRYIYSLVGTWQVTDRLKYVFQHDLGDARNEALRLRTNAQWYGINQYLLYTINDCWAAGMRVEWFRDQEGTRVHGLGDGNRNVGPYPGSFYEITAGLNWTPHANVMVRPELRWDWYDASRPVDLLPFDAGDRGGQFLLGCDFIVTY